MAKVFINIEIKGKGKLWVAQNGATRRTLVLIANEKDFIDGIDVKKGKALENVRVGFLDKGNHSFIFLNIGKGSNNNKTIGIFLNSYCGYECLNPEKEIYSNVSIGGYGNSESKFGVYDEGAIIKEFTYKYRTPSKYYILRDKGWRELGTKSDILEKMDLDEDARKIVKMEKWTDEIKYIE